jgi:hypothetical protein
MCAQNRLDAHELILRKKCFIRMIPLKEKCACQKVKPDYYANRRSIL